MKKIFFTTVIGICLLFFTISLILTAIMFFIEEEAYSLYFLYNANEMFGYLLFSFLFSILPIAIYFATYKINMLRNRLILSILIGYLPSFFILYFQIVY